MVVVVLGSTVLIGTTLGGRYRVAPPVLLICLGGLLGLVPGLSAVELDPDVVLLLFLPAILYWESLNTSLREIRANLRVIVLSSVVLVIVTMAAVAYAGRALGMDPRAAWVLGAVLAPTDAAAVAGLAKRLPRRTLTTLRAGESDQRRDGAGPVRGGDGGGGRRGVGGTVHDRGQLRGLLRGRYRRGPARQRPGRPGPSSARRSAAGGHAQRADAVPRLPVRRARARQRGGGGGRRRSRAHPRVAARHPRPVPGSGLRVLGPGHLHDQRRPVRTGRPAVPPGRGGSGREDPPRGAGCRGRHHGGRHRYPTGVVQTTPTSSARSTVGRCSARGASAGASGW